MRAIVCSGEEKALPQFRKNPAGCVKKQKKPPRKAVYYLDGAAYLATAIFFSLIRALLPLRSRRK